MLAHDAAKSGDEHLGDGPAGEFIHPMEARPVEYEPDNTPSYYDSQVHQRKMSPPVQQQMPVRALKSPPLQTSPTSFTHQGPGNRPAHDNVPNWYQEMMRGEKIPQQEDMTHGVHHRKPSYG